MRTLLPIAGMCSTLFMTGQWLNAGMAALLLALEFISLGQRIDNDEQ